MQNALGFMPGEHNWMEGKPMPGQTAPMQEKKRGPVMGALNALFQYGAPEAYQAGVQQKMNKGISNALAGGDYGGAAQAAYGANDWQTGMQLGQMGQQAQDAQRQQEAQGVLNLFSAAQPAQISEMAMTDPVGFERMTGMTADEYMQAGQRMAQAGLSPEQFHQYVIQKAQAELGMAPAGPVEGKAINNRLVDPYTGKVMGDYSDPAAPEYERVTTADGIYEYIPGQPESMRKIGEAPVKSPLVNVNTGDVGAGDRPIVDKPPKGYQRVWDPESQTYRDMPIPGSADERDDAAMRLKATQRLAAEGEQFSTMVSNIDDAINMVDNTSAGFGAMTEGIPTTPARNLKAKLETVQALIGFDKLNEMRQTSPTGGALGNVTERELAFLQSVRGSLDTRQSPEQLKATLADVKASLERLQEVREIAFRMENGLLEPGQEKPKVSVAPPDPAEIDALVNQYLNGPQ
ncbi:hypothetical protein [Hyphomonas sp. CY54-11-8]|uniref:hypothetical protein n=1 Tax=Hyphomonas sp. CY54-11-8 TaxID=1280944 RepID=UPI000458A16C|nr:hypothetical protein [Hyphomonas sp. CY54-11-8]KCZ47780.1 hypothetical protein HY17_04705 [Hyphomonas sp. CY54-11-8]